MIDKTRAEFEELFPAPAQSEWRQEYNYYCWRTMSAAHPHNDLWQAWLAAKEKYEPRWISVEERMPETWDFKICYASMNGIFIACLMNDGEFRMEHTDLRVRVTHWMEWPSTPRTQGEE